MAQLPTMGRVLSRAGVHTTPTIGSQILCCWPLDAEAQAMAKASRECTSVSVPVFGFRFSWIFLTNLSIARRWDQKNWRKSKPNWSCRRVVGFAHLFLPQMYVFWACLRSFSSERRFRDALFDASLRCFCRNKCYGIIVVSVIQWNRNVEQLNLVTEQLLV